LIKDPIERLNATTNLVITTTKGPVIPKKKDENDAGDNEGKEAAVVEEIKDAVKEKNWCEEVIEQLPTISYDKLRSLPIFASSFQRVIHSTDFYAAQFLSSVPSFASLPPVESTPTAEDISHMKSLYTPPTTSPASATATVRIPSLHEICLQQATETIIYVGNEISNNGGIRPDIPWIKSFNLLKLSALDRGRIYHQLVQKKKAHLPTISRLFEESVVDMKCHRSKWDTKDSLGYAHNLQGHALHAYHAAMVTIDHVQSHFVEVPAVNTAASSDGSTKSEKTPDAPGDSNKITPPAPPNETTIVIQEEEELKQSISLLNKLRPKFVFFFGSFLPIELEGIPGTAPEKLVDIATQRFRRLVARVSDTIGVMFVPSPHDLRHFSQSTAQNPSIAWQEYTSHILHPLPALTGGSSSAVSASHPLYGSLTMSGLAYYRQQFGADFYSFWYEGTKCIVLNTSLFFLPPLHTVSSPTEEVIALYRESLLQEIWFEKELEQSKLCATTMTVCMYHPWYFHDPEEDDLYWYANDAQPVTNSIEDEKILVTHNFPKEIRKKWLRKLQHHKVKYVFTSSFPGAAGDTEDGSIPGVSVSLHRPFAKKKKVAIVDDDKEETEEQTVDAEARTEVTNPANGDEDPESESSSSDVSYPTIVLVDRI
jgi:hypothetical protein